MDHWGRDILIDRRRLLGCAAGLLIARPALAGLVVTPRQTAGPFYPHTKPFDSDFDLTEFKGTSVADPSTVIEITGRVFSVKGEAIKDAVIEIWQADTRGTYSFPLQPDAPPSFQGYGAAKTNTDGAYRFRTVRPAAYGSGAFRRTPHIHFRVVTSDRRELVTQMYFPGEAMNASDFIYARLGNEALQAAVTARLLGQVQPPRFGFDLVLA